MLPVVSWDDLVRSMRSHRSQTSVEVVPKGPKKGERRPAFLAKMAEESPELQRFRANLEAAARDGVAHPKMTKLEQILGDYLAAPQQQPEEPRKALVFVFYQQAAQEIVSFLNRQGAGSGVSARMIVGQVRRCSSAGGRARFLFLSLIDCRARLLTAVASVLPADWDEAARAEEGPRGLSGRHLQRAGGDPGGRGGARHSERRPAHQLRQGDDDAEPSPANGSDGQVSEHKGDPKLLLSRGWQPLCVHFF